MARARKAGRRGYGTIRRLPSGRYQASYVGPDLLRHAGAHTFETRMDAEAWLAAERRLVDAPEGWIPPKQRAQRVSGELTLSEYAQGALARRRVRGERLKPRTLALYQSLLDRVILPELGSHTLRTINRDDVARFYDALDPSHPTQRAHAYGLLSTVLGQAVAEGVISVNSCQIKGAGRTSRVRRIEPASLDELATIVAAMPERLRLFVLLGAWCGMRYGELAELRRGDIDVGNGVLVITRAVVRVNGQDVVGTPKSHAGERVVAVPPHLLDLVRAHLDEHTAKGSDALLFHRPGTDRHLIHTEVSKTFALARLQAGRADLRLHDLRHTGAVLAAQTGATLAELMARLGHSTPTAAMRYQHAARGRDGKIAAALSRMVEAPRPVAGSYPKWHEPGKYHSRLP